MKNNNINKQKIRLIMGIKSKKKENIKSQI